MVKKDEKSDYDEKILEFLDENAAPIICVIILGLFGLVLFSGPVYVGSDLPQKEISVVQVKYRYPGMCLDEENGMLMVNMSNVVFDEMRICQNQ